MDDSSRGAGGRWYVAATLALVAAAVALWFVDAAGLAGRERALEQIEALVPHRLLWVRLLRGGLGRLTIPFLCGVLAICLVVAISRGRRRQAALMALVAVVANGSVQAVKHGLLPLAPHVGDPSLSGHPAMAIAAAFAALVVVPARWHARVGALAAVVVVGTVVGVVVAGWHTPWESLAPAFVALAVAFGCWPLASRVRRRGVSEPSEAAAPGGPS